jgi:nucleoprotein TPR
VNFKLQVSLLYALSSDVGLTRTETNRAKTESELEQLRSASSSDASEVATLKSRISSLETSNRDTLGLLESKTNAFEKASQDLSAQHQKSTELRKQVASLEQAAQSSHSAAASAKFREQSLQQEIDLLKKNNEWLENERKLKADEYTAFRKEKNARISELSRSNEQYIADAEALKRSETSLKQRLDESAHKYEDLQQELQKVREEKLAADNSNKIDMEGKQRLVHLLEASVETHKQRVKELSQELEDTQENAAETIGEIRAAAESDHEEKEAAVRKISELESTISQLQADIEQERARPSTPQRTINGSAVGTPVRPSTPLGVFSPATRGTKSVTQTQMFTEYKRMEQDLAAAKREKKDLQDHVDDMLEKLEQMAPELDELRTDRQKQEKEIVEMSSLVDAANKERDEAARSSRIAHGQLEARSKEVAVLQQQLRDLSSQVRRLVMEINVLNEGGRMTDADWAEMQRKHGEDQQAEMEGLSPTQRLVNERLIAFKNISELQQQNQDQLASIRDLVSQLEDRNAPGRQEKFAAMEEELQSCRTQIAGFQDEIKTMVAQSKSFVKERDMFRNMLTRKGHLGDVTDFSRSLPIPPGGSPGPAHSVNGGDSDFAKVIKELQQQFDSYRSETLVDQSSLKSQVDELLKRNSELQMQASRLQSQLSAATQRAEMLQSNYDMLKNENVQLQTRSYAAMENANRQELKVQQTAEDLVQTKGLNDSLQRESANLKAEKDLWKNVEKRLLDDNESLRNDRNRLDQLNSSLQTIISEREQTDSETRRRLQAQVESLENELQTTKRKLTDEQEEGRKASLSRQYEQEQRQKRVDELVASLGTVREELASTKTSRDHLQARVDELTVELRAAEERLEIYTKPANPSDETAQDDPVSREQELTLEITDLKSELERTKSNLDHANESIETYKNIAQTAEEGLEEFGETHDKYREETDASISEKDAKIKELEQRIEDISEELQNTNGELSKLRDEQQDVDRRLEEQKTTYEAQIERLKESEATAIGQAQFNLDATKAQYEIAQQSTKNYEDELVKHAAAAEDLRKMRGEAHQLRLEMVDLRSQAETARVDLQQKESSWSEQKDRYEQELTDIKSRREELSVQNNRLHQQLEGLTKQVTALKQDRAALAEGSEESSNEPSLENLQEVIKYLRQEKQIVDQQYHNTSHTLKSVQQKLEFTQTQLDETRLKLDQQRRSELDSERNAMSHNKMMELLDSVNLHRESNVTLRAENKQMSETLAEKTRKIEELEAQIQPLQARVAELENVVETRDGEMKILHTDRDHWRQRTQDIISKYNRVDPAELEGMKEQLENLQKERDEAVAARDTLQSEIDTIPDQIKSAKDQQRSVLGEQFKTQMKTRVGQKQTELDSANAEKTALQQELDEVREQLESARNHPRDAEEVQANGDSAPSPGEAPSGGDERVATLEAAIEQKDQQIATLQNEHKAALQAKEDQLKGHLNKKFTEFKQEAQNAKDTALQELRTQLEQQNSDALEALRAELATSSDTPKPTAIANDSVPTAPVDVSSEVSEEQLLAVPMDRWKWAAKNVPSLKTLLTNSIKSQLEKAKAANQSGDGASPAQLEAVREQMEAALNKKQAEFDAEKEALEKQYQERLDKEKSELEAAHQQVLENQKLGFSEESAKKIEEQIKAAELIAAQKATELSEKKSSLKLNMASNRANTAAAKLKVVEDAATTTPERAVKEVWDEAKVAKAPPPPKPAPTPQATAPPSSPAPAAAAAATSQPASQQVKETSSEPAQNNEDAKTEPEPEQPPQQPAGPSQPTPNGPTKPNVGTGPSALRNVSGLPRGASGIARGPRGGSQIARGASTGIPRGAARGGARGGARSVSMGGSNPRGGMAGSPTRGGLNPGANQFVPGNKRAREDGDGADGGQKRMRGGGHGS